MQVLEEAWQQHLAPRQENAPTVISLFAGCGGSSLGYSMAGYRELLAVEWNAKAVAIFRQNFPAVPVYHGDIHACSVEQIIQQTGLKAGELDVLDGSPPCQGFSMGGKRILDDPRNHMFMEYVRILQGVQPKAFIMENVPGLIKGKMKLIFSEILRTLKDSGYSVKVRLMNAMYFHVPQNRGRLIFIGMRKDLLSIPSHPHAQAKPFGISLPHTRTIQSKISAHHVKTALAHKARHHAQKHGFGFPILSGDRPAPTWPRTMMVPTSAPRYVCKGEHWLPSAMELSAIGSFPLQFTFPGTFSDQWASIGNSVPPLFMRAIAQHVRQLLGI